MDQSGRGKGLEGIRILNKQAISFFMRSLNTYPSLVSFLFSI